MTVSDIIKEVELQRPGHGLSAGTICSIIEELEDRIYQELVCTHENSDNVERVEIAINDNAKLIAPKRYKDMYVFYVLAKIDYVRQDTVRYTNNMIMYNQVYDDFGNWYNRTYLPLQNNRIG